MRNMFFLSLFVLGIAVFGQNIQFTSTNGEEYESGVVEFGTINKGGNAEKTVLIKNTGDKPLIITKAQGGCSCTVPSYPKEPIMPGKTAEMKIKYKTTGVVGKFSKAVTVYSNAVDRERTLVRIKGEIKDLAEGS